MREVLSLQYDAAAAAIVVAVANVKPSEHVPGALVRQLGAPEPQARFTIDALPEPHRSALRSLLAALPTMVETEHAALATDPDAVARKAAALAAKEQELAAAEAGAHEVVAQKAAEAAAIEAQIAEKREVERAGAAALVKLDAEIAKKRAELAAIGAEPTPTR